MSAQPQYLPERRLTPSMVKLVDMHIGQLDKVLSIETRAYPFPWTRGNFIDSLAAGYRMQCLFSRGELAGYYIAMKGVDEVHLLNIAVAPEHQGHGHARTMLASLTHFALLNQLPVLLLEVRPSNIRARNLYEGTGFELVGVRRGYYPDHGGKREDALVMRRQVGGVVNPP
ncbi:MAG: ribosomal-protein-alanine N-acetyltransferase [Pseudomonadota bacterium]|jgi:ribosomal-protein-alanine N-acetyltransferase